MLDDDSEGKRQSAALGGSRDSFFLHHVKELKNSNYSVNSDALSIHWDRPGYAAVTMTFQGLRRRGVGFSLILGALGVGRPFPRLHTAVWNTVGEGGVGEAHGMCGKGCLSGLPPPSTSWNSP